MPTSVHIESLDQDGRGIARVDGKAVFVEGALPGEAVTLVTLRRKPTYDLARVERMEKASSSRVAPHCPHFGVCGGCTLQHADMAMQVAAKQRVLEEALARIGRVRAGVLLPPVVGPAWGYRYRARLSVRNVVKKGGVLVGFHERKSSYVADMTECHVLPRKISDLLQPLRSLVGSLSVRDRLPQIEVAIGERRVAGRDGLGEEVHALVLRVLAPPTASDEDALRTFAGEHRVDLYLQPGGPASVVPFHVAHGTLAYALPEFNIELPFAPTEFTQVNLGINRVLVRRAVALLQPQAGERIADFFCGIGNFTLPIARHGASVVGVEGSESLARRGTGNAAYNGLSDRVRFVVANLFEATPDSLAPLLPLDKVLIDPPREGAVQLAKALPAAGAQKPLRRIAYVSCNPATLARDAGVLVHERGYSLTLAGVINMFPHTGHVESIALFEPEPGAYQ